MRKSVLVIICALLFVMCKSKQAATTTAAAEEIKVEKTNVQYRDDFRATADKNRVALLKDLKATEKNYSVLIFTKGYKGEGIQVSNENKVLFSGNVISNLKTGIANTIRIDNNLDTKIFDSFTKKSVILELKDTKKYKYVYVLKDNSNKESPFSITYSNTLRPLK